MTQAQNEGEEDTRHHELVIIRRRGNSEDAPHKGGVWKIAHADFMTALMAFFLVMWLITATDDKTITGVANYFNPIRLSDQAAKSKGVFSMEPGGEADNKDGPKQPSEQKGKNADAQKASVQYSETELFKDPYQALDKIAAEAEEKVSSSEAGNKMGGPARHRGEAFRDPFNPDNPYEAATPSTAAGQAGNGGGGKAGSAKGKADSADSEFLRAAPSKASERGYAKLRRKIEDIVKQSDFATKPGIDVSPTDEGLLISITDQFDFEMFGIASAQPTPELVVLMERIGEVLAQHSGHIVVRGHTDGRPFRSDSYDNWRLSTARAHMAHYMLLRSGITEDRITRVEGHADHDLKVHDDPYAAANRRIEILLDEDE